MVRSGAAAIAAIDCVTWACLCDVDPEAVTGLAVRGTTACAPGLPLIAGRFAPDRCPARLHQALLAPGPALRAAMAPLRIAAFQYRDAAGHAGIDGLEAEARRLGYRAGLTPLRIFRIVVIPDGANHNADNHNGDI
ncbi:hypothetical protein ACFFTM_13315 [Pseudoduganella plicata]|uniref:Uncharacterized protein n=1 Tax=Pseudoduganella plicata TaxID=321984 RepID=A0AA88C9F6_9BURK|nr:hypothetical protein [Pseudoduganella plicata]GGY96363.1 hypothetical protein GCM10007388_32290 [Pseudoduganella plicata]